MYKTTVEVGIVLRKSFRHYCDYHDIEYKESKGLLTSLFVVRGTHEQLTKMKQACEALED